MTLLRNKGVNLLECDACMRRVPESEVPSVAKAGETPASSGWWYAMAGTLTLHYCAACYKRETPLPAREAYPHELPPSVPWWKCSTCEREVLSIEQAAKDWHLVEVAEQQCSVRLCPDCWKKNQDKMERLVADGQKAAGKRNEEERYRQGRMKDALAAVTLPSAEVARMSLTPEAKLRRLFKPIAIKISQQIAEGVNHTFFDISLIHNKPEWLEFIRPHLEKLGYRVVEKHNKTTQERGCDSWVATVYWE